MHRGFFHWATIMAQSSAFIGWFYELNGRRLGPLSADKIADLLRVGILRAHDRVWRAWKDETSTTFYQCRAESVRLAQDA